MVSSLVSVIVPVSPGWKVIVLPASAIAIAKRKLPPSLSFRFVTTGLGTAQRASTPHSVRCPNPMLALSSNKAMIIRRFMVLLLFLPLAVFDSWLRDCDAACRVGFAAAAAVNAF